MKTLIKKTEKKKRIVFMDDLNHNLVLDPIRNEVMVFIDGVFYARRPNIYEAKKAVRRVFENRRCFF